jgi:hypothetical protein
MFYVPRGNLMGLLLLIALFFNFNLAGKITIWNDTKEDLKVTLERKGFRAGDALSKTPIPANQMLIQDDNPKACYDKIIVHSNPERTMGFTQCGDIAFRLFIGEEGGGKAYFTSQPYANLADLKAEESPAAVYGDALKVENTTNKNLYIAIYYKDRNGATRATPSEPIAQKSTIAFGRPGRKSFFDRELAIASTPTAFKDKLTVAELEKLSPVNVGSKWGSNFYITLKKNGNLEGLNELQWTAIKPSIETVDKQVAERSKMPAGVQDIFDRFGDSPIQELSVFRQPIQTGVRELMLALTSTELKQLNYDDLFHTGFIIKCKDPLNGEIVAIRLERNHTVKADIYKIKPEGDEEFEQVNVTLPKAIGFREFLIKAMENDPKFWTYNPINRNCQLFVLQCLEKNNIKVSDDLYKFIYQDAGKVLANSPVLKAFAKDVTSLANRIDRAVESATYLLIQNGTPYTLRVKTRYVGESKFFGSCRPDDLVLEPGREKNVYRGICLLDRINVAAEPLQGAEASKTLPDELDNSFSLLDGRTSSVLIRMEGKKFILETRRLPQAELLTLAKAAPAP